MKISALGAGALMVCAALGAAAQKVYRCGPDASIYQQAPCADGQAVDVSDPRTAEQRQQAQELAKSDARAAAKFDRDTTAASSTQSDKAKPEPARKDRAASSPRTTSKKPDSPSKPLVFLVPMPRGAASVVKPQPLSALSELRLRRHQSEVPGPQRFAALQVRRIDRDAVHRADLHALRFVVVTDALGAPGGVDLVDFGPHRDGLVRALRLAHIAVDALVGDQQRHALAPSLALGRFARARPQALVDSG